MSIADWLQQRIQVASVTSTASTGDPVYGAPRTVRARVQLFQRMVRTATGEEASSTHRVYTLDPIRLTDRIWLPGTPSSSPEGSKVPLAVEAPTDKAAARTLYQTDL